MDESEECTSTLPSNRPVHHIPKPITRSFNSKQKRIILKKIKTIPAFVSSIVHDPSIALLKNITFAQKQNLYVHVEQGTNSNTHTESVQSRIGIGTDIQFPICQSTAIGRRGRFCFCGCRQWWFCARIRRQRDCAPFAPGRSPPVAPRTSKRPKAAVLFMVFVHFRNSYITYSRSVRSRFVT